MIGEALFKGKTLQTGGQVSTPSYRRLFQALQTVIQAHYSPGQSPAALWYPHRDNFLQCKLDKRLLYIEMAYIILQLSGYRSYQTDTRRTGSGSERLIDINARALAESSLY